MRRIFTHRRKWLDVKPLPVFCVVAAVALVGKLGDVALDAGNAAIAQARAAPSSAPVTAAAPAAPAPAQPEPAAKPRPAPPVPVDTETLKALAERRAELEKRGEEIRERETLLEATEKRVEEKIARLEALEKTIETAVKQRDAEEEARIRSLVKIYETMKPKDAARVLEQLDMPVLLSVIEKMKEAKTAAILAAMDPSKAKSLTVAIAEKNDAPPKAN